MGYGHVSCFHGLIRAEKLVNHVCLFFLERLFEDALNELDRDPLVRVARIGNALVILALLKGKLLLEVLLLLLISLLYKSFSLHLGRLLDLALTLLPLAHAREETPLVLLLAHFKPRHALGQR